MRPVALGATSLLLCLSGALGYGQRRQAPPPRPRFAAPQQRAERPRMQQQQPRYNNQLQSRPQGGAQRVTPAYPNTNYGGAATRPAYPGGAGRPAYGGQGYAPPGHLQSWLNQHRNLPPQDQERLLRNDPAFSHQAPAQQQREMQQLHNVDQMPEQQRERRLARNEMLERLSPQQRMNLNQASRSFAALPPDRRQMMGRAFQDLRGVPLDQRETVLNSARYQGQFSPQERDILTNFLRVEPYQASH
jgi:hypothetical protein